ncbi:NOL1/NOP2/Sun domain family, member 2, putative [Acanthamoeba castellanii str. Neff]|uniref:NOL1/NOP2/Sun domain family, member 2, putative n=1 Tax=Acanthamoeba castellanii (strain ATCC 30010 / Neff) TaxID=1257118 RepID=L8GEK7_ACACF|nr:NOL1/NOP2/Sun domain family, member 2, putative [Acanthamoeba castellanii str. Neff]ELR11304.1 NOL1/NOP2/Sun domain family, member 2, putative [Acanthamoeba castellanii str. Neff]
MTAEEEGKDTAASAAKGKDTRRRRHNQGNREEPYLPLSAGLTAEWELVKEYFGIKESFPEQQLMARGEGSPRIYFLSSAVSNVLWRNTSRFSKVVNTGIRMLVKHAPPDAKCHYRPCQEGLEWLYPYMTKRLVTVSFDDMAKLILEDTPFMTSFTPETQAQLEPLGSPMLACGWKARTSAHLLVDKHARKSWSFLFSLKPAETTATTSTAVAGEATTTAESSSVATTSSSEAGSTDQ